jgi:hypothetical protein
MGNRAVGGASAAGCGVLGFGGLLIGVALTVWLGSQVTGGIGGGGGSDGSKDLQELTSEVSALANPTIDGLPVGGATLTVTSTATLDNGDLLPITGMAFEPGPIEVTACLANVERTADGAAACDLTTTAVATVDGRGSFGLMYPAKRVLVVDGTAYDCAAAYQACTIVAHPKDAFDVGTTAGLTFANDLPPVDAQPPP